MQTILNVSTNLLRDYTDFEKVNDNWNILSYLNYNYDINAALSFSKLFFPDFIEENGCIVLSFLYNKENFNEWFDEFNGNKSEIEKMCNLYELKDFFHIKDERNEEVLREFGKVIQKSWEINLSILFPQKKFCIKVFEEYNSLFLTLYQVGAA